MEQGKAVVLSSIFSPPAWVGIGIWWRCLIFPLLRLMWAACGRSEGRFVTRYVCKKARRTAGFFYGPERSYFTPSLNIWMAVSLSPEMMSMM